MLFWDVWVFGINWINVIHQPNSSGSFTVTFPVNLLYPGRYGSNIKSVISEHMLWIKLRAFLVKLLPGEKRQNVVDDMSK